MANPSHEKLSNQALGISETSRDGTKVAIPDAYFRQVLTCVEQKDDGVACAMRLSRLLRLRTEETVQSAKSLRTWQKLYSMVTKKYVLYLGQKEDDQEIQRY
jgi:hypothetical protein